MRFLPVEAARWNERYLGWGRGIVMASSTMSSEAHVSMAAMSGIKLFQPAGDGYSSDKSDRNILRPA